MNENESEEDEPLIVPTSVPTTMEVKGYLAKIRLFLQSQESNSEIQENQIDGLDDFVTKICLRKKKQTIISDYFVKL